jgi:hypothetical protein
MPTPNPVDLERYLNTLSTQFSVYLALLLIYGAVGLILSKKDGLQKPYNLLAPYLLLVFLFEALAHYFSLAYRNNAPPYHVFSWMQLCFFGYVYYHSFSETKRKIAVFWVVVMLLVLSICASFFVHRFWQFPKFNLLSLTLVAVSFSLFHFKEMLQYPGQKSLVREPMFWINTAHLVFFGLSFFIWEIQGIGGRGSWVFKLIFSVNLIMYTAYFFALMNNRFTKSA